MRKRLHLRQKGVNKLSNVVASQIYFVILHVNLKPTSRFL